MPGDYHSLWKRGAIQRVMYEYAGWQCEHCQLAFPVGSTKSARAFNADGKPVILTVHHIDGNPENNSWRNLLTCCQACHLHIQARWKPGGVLPVEWGTPPAWLTSRFLPYEVNPQATLFEGEVMTIVRYIYLINTGEEAAVQVPTAKRQVIDTLKARGFVEVSAADYGRFLAELEARDTIAAGGAR